MLVPQVLLAWQTFLLFSILFYHSNFQLPKSVEKPARTSSLRPFMHGIHRSNESQIKTGIGQELTLWDFVER